MFNVQNAFGFFQKLMQGQQAKSVYLSDFSYRKISTDRQALKFQKDKSDEKAK